MLTYNLENRGEQSLALTAEMRCGEQAALAKVSDVLDQWRDLDEAGNALVYVLGHKVRA